jgi:translation elongation factor EF-1alpha
LLKKSDKMTWWSGTDVYVGEEKLHVETVYEVLDKMCRIPERPKNAPMRMPTSGIYKIKGVGDVLAGRVEQGIVKPGEEVVFLPTHTSSNPCNGKVFTVEMHHKQIYVGVNKMDCDVAGYQKDRYDEIANEMRNRLQKVGWKKDFIEKNVPYMPISGWMGDNLLKKSDKMTWWSSTDVYVGEENLHVETVYEVLDKMCRIPERPKNAPMRMPISGIYKIKGVGDVLAGRVEQGIVKPGEEVVFLPTHTSSNPCNGKVFTVEMHHKRMDEAMLGDNAGLNIKDLDKQNMPRGGDVMIYKKDGTLTQTAEFDAQIQVPDIPGEIKVGYSPIGHHRLPAALASGRRAHYSGREVSIWSHTRRWKS